LSIDSIVEGFVLSLFLLPFTFPDYSNHASDISKSITTTHPFNLDHDDSHFFLCFFPPLFPSPSSNFIPIHSLHLIETLPTIPLTHSTTLPPSLHRLSLGTSPFLLLLVFTTLHTLSSSLVPFITSRETNRVQYDSDGETQRQFGKGT